jgi:hypothetical protein
MYSIVFRLLGARYFFPWAPVVSFINLSQ